MPLPDAEDLSIEREEGPSKGRYTVRLHGAEARPAPTLARENPSSSSITRRFPRRCAAAPWDRRSCDAPSRTPGGRPLRHFALPIRQGADRASPRMARRVEALKRLPMCS